MIHELDAVAAHLCDLSKKHLSHTFETFHEGWEFEAHSKETQWHVRKWKASKH